MSDDRFAETVVRADERSKAVAVAVTLVVLLFGVRVLENLEFASIAAISVGIGTRMIIPYSASLSIPPAQRVPVDEHPAAGAYHHGAMGGALLLAGAVAIATMYVTVDYTVALGSAILGGAVTFLVLSRTLPRG